MKKTYLFIPLIAVTYCCTPANNSSGELKKDPKTATEIRDELHREVMKVHDIAMVKMQTIMNLKNIIIRQIDSLRESGEKLLVQRIGQLEKSQLTLEEANKSMMVWMREFTRPSDTVSHDLAIEYLKSEQDKIEGINDRMGQTIEQAEALEGLRDK